MHTRPMYATAGFRVLCIVFFSAFVLFLVPSLHMFYSCSSHGEAFVICIVPGGLERANEAGLSVLLLPTTFQQLSTDQIGWATEIRGREAFGDEG